MQTVKDLLQVEQVVVAVHWEVGQDVRWWMYGTLTSPLEVIAFVVGNPSWDGQTFEGTI